MASILVCPSDIFLATYSLVRSSVLSLPMAMSGKKLPVRSFGMRSVSVPTQVAKLRIPVAVAAVRPAAAQLVGFGVHHRIHDLLGEAP